jgi:branched-chain amino acid transport system substrate-binding protein
VFRGCPSADIEGLAGGEFAASMPFKKWYVIGEDYEYGHSIADNFWKGLKKNKPDVEKIMKHGPSWWAGLQPYMTALAAQKPDAIYVLWASTACSQNRRSWSD